MKYKSDFLNEISSRGFIYQVTDIEELIGSSLNEPTDQLQARFQKTGYLYLKQALPKGSDRAIGWDTPSQNGKSSAGDYFSEHSYGHLGFTGTSLWIDPKNEIVVILLTNRVHPSRNKEGIYGIRREFHNKVMAAILN